MKKMTQMAAYAALALCYAGCVNLKPKPDRTQIFALASEVEASNEVVGQPECYVARVELPGFLQSTRIHYRSVDGRLNEAAHARWAEELDAALPRALALHLQAEGRSHVRGYYPWANTDKTLATVSVQFERFSANAEGQVEVIAQWQVLHPDGSGRQGRYVATGLAWDGATVAEYVAQLSQGLDGLAAAIAEAL